MSATKTAGEAVLVEETDHGPFQNRVTTGSSTFLVDEPMGAGGMGSGPNPYDLLSAAIGACTTMTVRLYATKKGWPLERARARIVHTKGAVGARDRFDVELDLAGRLDAAQRARLLEVARHCPVHLSFERGSTVETSLLLPESTIDEAVTRFEHAHDMSEVCDSLLP